MCKIWAPRPFGDNAVCVKFSNGDKEISVALDDSCGAFRSLSRGDIRCFIKAKDVTNQVFPGEGTVYASVEALEQGLTWLKL